MTTICFVRHASSTYNDQGRMAGLLDPPLSQAGEMEAQLTATYLAHVSFDAVYSSPLERAVSTARILIRGRALTPRLSPEIVELDMGVFAGQRWTDVVHDYRRLFGDGELRFWRLFANNLIPEQEPFADAVKRIMQFFRQVTTAHPEQTVLVVGHKGVLEVFLSQTIGFDPSSDWFAIDGASVTVIHLMPQGTVRFVTINARPTRIAI